MTYEMKVLAWLAGIALVLYILLSFGMFNPLFDLVISFGRHLGG